MSIEFDKKRSNSIKITVMGVGGGGGNSVNRMCAMRDDVKSGKAKKTDGVQSIATGTNVIFTDETMQIEYIVLNTDAKVLETSRADYKVQLGEKLTEGTGAGGDPEVGEKSAEESREKIAQMLADTKMLIITAGMGGGTGTGASPFIAKLAREMGILTVAIVTKPFDFEGSRRMNTALGGVSKLHSNVDSILVIPNQKLVTEDEDLSVAEAFRRADDVLAQTVSFFSEIVSVTGIVNNDFADLTKVLRGAGYAHLGVGTADLSADGDPMRKAMEMAINSSLLETNLSGAKSVLINIVTPSLSKVGMKNLDSATKIIKDIIDEGAEIFSGLAELSEIGDQVRISVVATRFNEERKRLAEKGYQSAQGGAPTEQEKQREDVTTVGFSKPAENHVSEEVSTFSGIGLDAAEKSEFNIDDIIKMLNRRTSP